MRASRTNPGGRAAGIAVVIAASLALTGCGGGGLSDTGEPLTIEQSEQLAQTRFRLATADTFAARVSVGDPESNGYYAADLTVSTSDHLAWGELHLGPVELAIDEPLMTSPAMIAVQYEGRWQSGPPNGAGYVSLSALNVVFSLSADRPENAQLLRQSDAAYLGSETLEGETLEVYRLATEDGDAGRTRLWLTEDGELRRLDDGGDGLTIDVIDGDAGEPRPAEIECVLGLEGSADG